MYLNYKEKQVNTQILNKYKKHFHYKSLIVFFQNTNYKKNV